MNSVPVPIEAGAQPELPATEVPNEEELMALLTAPLPKDIEPRQVATQKAYRLLVSCGVTGLEAASLIGIAVGLHPTGTSRWTLKQINRLLFLQNLYLNTPWGDEERRPA